MENEEYRESRIPLMANNTGNLNQDEFRELEELTMQFGGKFKEIVIEENSVYGCTDHEKKHLGTKTKYYRYRKLKIKNSAKSKKDDEEYRAHESFLESYKRLNSPNNI